MSASAAAVSSDASAAAVSSAASAAAVSSAASAASASAARVRKPSAAKAKALAKAAKARAIAPKAIVKKLPHAAAIAVNERVWPRCKHLSFSFRGECMVDVSAVILNVLRTENTMPALCGYSVKTTAPDPDVEGTLVFRYYDGDMARFVMSIEATLMVIAELEEDVHVINETLTFTPEYDGKRTFTGVQREGLMDRIEEKLKEVPFAFCYIKPKKLN